MNVPPSSSLVPVVDLDRRHSALRLPDPRRVAMLRASLERHGQLSPVLVNSRDDGTAVVVDGFKRIEVLESLGQADVMVRWLQVDEAQETATIVTSNRSHRGMTALEEGWVVRSLVRHSQMSQAKVGVLLGRHKSWVCRRLKLAESLVDSVREDVRVGLISATVAREVARLPRGNQTEVVESLRSNALSSREASEVVKQWLDAPDRVTRKAITDDPRAFISSTEVSEPRSADPWNRFREAIEELEKSASMTRQRTRKVSGRALDEGRRQTLERPLRRVVHAVRDTLLEIEAVAASWEVSDYVEP